MKCPSCGAELNDSSKFCTNCGKTIEIGVPNQNYQQTPVVAYESTPQPQKKKKNTVLIVVLIVLGILFVIGFIAAFIFVSLFKNITKEVKSNKQNIIDVVDNYEEKRVIDPIGHEIIIKQTDPDYYIVELSYIENEIKQLEDNIIIMTSEEVESTQKTPDQKEAMNAMFELMENNKNFTKKDIIQDLQDKNYTEEIINNIMSDSGINWKQQARINALNTMLYSGYSKISTTSFLEKQGYKEEEISYAMDDLDYYGSATNTAFFKKYLYKNDREDAKYQLEQVEFTEEEIEFALKTAYDEMD